MAGDDAPSGAHLALAFGLVLAAGLSTTIGAATAFCSNLANRQFLAGALGLSAGVMMYVSFVEIFATKSITGFQDAGYTDVESSRYATLCFFGGMLLLWILDKFVHGLIHTGEWLAARNKARAQARSEGPSLTNSSVTSVATVRVDVEAGVPASAPSKTSETAGPSSSSTPVPAIAPPACCMERTSCCPEQTEVVVAERGVSATLQRASRQAHAHGHCHGHTHDAIEIPKGEPQAIREILEADHHHTSLAKTGLLAALAIGIHNFPEGLATFVATLADPTAGIAIAVAIALHNIPEGIVVSMPIYYATGSKWKAFFWGCISGISEPIGALIGYLILHGKNASPMMYGLMFGVVGGMMVYISITELLPTALKYDPEDKWVTRMAVVGMIVMAASLLLFAA